MTIEQIIKYLPAPICGDTVIGKEKQKEYDAYDSAVIILHKYQKIAELYDYWRSGKYEYTISCMENIGKVLRDEKNVD